MRTNPTPPNQPRNILAATLGALLGLLTLFWNPTGTSFFATLIARYLQHETLIASVAAAALILFLSHLKPQNTKAVAWCGVLGLVCTRLTVSLIQ